MKQYLTPKQVADKLQVKPTTVYVWLHRGVPLPYVKIEGTIRFDGEAVDQWILERTQNRKRKEFR